MNDFVALLTGYLIGSLLPAYLLGRSRGVDLRTRGDGNLGATNAGEQFGRSAGRAVAALDILKGPAAVAAAAAIGAGPWALYGAGLAAILGHRYPFYLGFRGGRGFATSAGLLASGLAYAVFQGWLPVLDGALLVSAYTGLWLRFRDRAIPNALLLPPAFIDIALRQAPIEFAVCLGVVTASVWLFNLRRLLAMRSSRARDV